MASCEGISEITFAVSKTFNSPALCGFLGSHIKCLCPVFILLDEILFSILHGYVI